MLHRVSEPQNTARLAEKLMQPRSVVPINTALGRRIKALRDGYAARLGGWDTLDTITADNVRRAAELVALSEKLRRDALRDCDVDPLILCRLDNSARRAVRELQLDVPRDKPKPPTLDQWMAGFAEQSGVTSGQAHRAPRLPARARTPAQDQNKPVKPVQGKKRPPTGRPSTGRRAG
jgi:hypothetical protein